MWSCSACGTNGSPIQINIRQIVHSNTRIRLSVEKGYSTDPYELLLGHKGVNTLTVSDENTRHKMGLPGR